MKRLMLAALLTSSLATFAAAAAAPAADDAVFLEGTRYNAVLSRGERAWRLLPATGNDLRLQVAQDCRTGAAPPRGLWLLTRDSQGRPELLAPSATALPAGHPGHIRLVDCGQPIAAGEAALAVPAGLVDWLQQNSGSIYVGH